MSNAHCAALKEYVLQNLGKNQNLIWSLPSKWERIEHASNISTSEWIAYFGSEFTVPDVVLELRYEEELDSIMSDNFDDCSLSPSLISKRRGKN